VTGDPDLKPFEEVVRLSDILILCTPHTVFADADLQGKEVYDIWNFLKN
jgi:hypothetical protein